MRRSDRAPHAAQPDLFCPRHPAPNWRSLPAEVREKVIRLLVRVLCEREPANRLDRAVGGRDDE